MEMKKSGFTLIEIMVVVGILGIIAVLGSGAFFSILRGSTKTKTLQMVKQNGDYAISVMERMIRNARVLINPTTNSTVSSITIKNPDGGTTTFSCEGNPATIASNGASLLSNVSKISNCNNIFEVNVGQVGIKPAVVKINLNLTQSGTVSRPEDQAEVNFQTTVTLRNY
jgi:prepilin-type N-terminal cleavage/methylation domain-containing protein